MSILDDPQHPMYVHKENRKIAQDRAQKYVEMISDYLRVRNKIPTGSNQQKRIRESKKRILKVLNATENDWSNWHWHLRHAIRSTDVLSKIISLNKQEIRDIEKTATQYRWSISPYYASLIDPDDRDCPIRMQSVPLIKEYLDEEEQKDPYAIVYNSPAPLITRL